MVNPKIESWSGGLVSGVNLDATTYGQGTTIQRSAITSWPTDRIFYDTTSSLLYRNSGTINGVIWTLISPSNTGNAKTSIPGGSITPISIIQATSTDWATENWTSTDTTLYGTLPTGAVEGQPKGRIRYYNNFTLNSGSTITSTKQSGEQGSGIVILCTGTCTINGTINVSSVGASGTPTGSSGGGRAGGINPGGGGNPSFSGGSGGTATQGVRTDLQYGFLKIGNTGGGSPANPPANIFPLTNHTDVKSLIAYPSLWGSGGGSGAPANGGTGGSASGTSSGLASTGGSGGSGGSSGTGGTGGGYVLIIANTIIIGSSGIINSSGQAGTNGGNGTSGGNGSGSTFGGTANADGGNGGSAGSGGSGGNGGCISLLYENTLTETGGSSVVVTAGTAGTAGSVGTGGSSHGGGSSGSSGSTGSAGSAGKVGLIQRFNI